jgi:flagellar hook protein FlgE
MAVGSFSAGLSGLNANAQALSVIGNDLANINTIGYKSSAVTFQDLVSQSVGGSSENPAQIGLGVGLGSISPIFSQGAIESTRLATNVAIQGDGFFLLNGAGGQSYTRAGAFSFNKDGALVSPDGEFVQGYTTPDPVTGQIIATGATTDIVVPPGVLRPPTKTTQFQATSNLDAGAATGDTFTTSIQIYDSLGAPHVTTMTYTKAAGAGAWAYKLTAPGDEVTGGTPGTPSQLATGTLAFNATGQLTTVNGAAPANVAITTPTWTTGAAASALNWQILDAQGNKTLTGFSAPSATSSITQNGSAPGMVTRVSP